MNFWIFMFICNLLVPVSMVIFGYYFYKKSSLKINSYAGYRTTLSTKNEDTWQFANRYFSKRWLYAGLVLMPLTIIVMIFLIGQDKDTIGNTGLVIGGLMK